MGPKTLFLRPLYYSTLIVSIIDPPFKEPFKGTPILIIKAPILYYMTLFLNLGGTRALWLWRCRALP